jgi:hypothetical protein
MSEPRIAFEDKPDLGEYISTTGSIVSNDAPPQERRSRLSLTSIDTDGNDSSEDEDEVITHGLEDASQVGNDNAIVTTTHPCSLSSCFSPILTAVNEFWQYSFLETSFGICLWSRK